MLEPGIAEIGLVNDPYPHVALQPALRGYADLERDWPEPESFADSIRMHGDLTHGDARYATLMASSSAYARLHDWVYSAAFIQDFLGIFRTAIDEHVASGALVMDPRELPIHVGPLEGRKLIGPGHAGGDRGQPILFTRLDLGIGKQGYGRINGGGGVHVDHATRLISVLVYVGANESMVGGEHRLYGLWDGIPQIRREYRPAPNLLIASLQSNLALHSVNPITHIKGVRKAMYMSVACTAGLWKKPPTRALERLTRNRYQPSAWEKAISFIRRS